MNKLKQLKRRKSQILARLEQLDKSRDVQLTPEIADEVDSLGEELTNVKADIRNLEASQNRQVVPGRTSNTPNSEFRSAGDFLQAVIRSDTPGQATDPRLLDIQARAASGASEGVQSDGGFLVSSDLGEIFLGNLYDVSKVAKYCRRVEISSNSNRLSLPALAESSRADGSRWGGVRAYWAGEADAYTASHPKLRQMEFKLKKLIGLGYASDELLADAAALSLLFQTVYPQELAFKLDDAIIEGTGAGMPLGIKNSAALIAVSAETGQAATTIVAENIEKMYARQANPESAVWFINQDCWPQIFQLHHVVGTGGVPMFVPAGGLSRSPAPLLLSRPVIPVEFCETLGTQGDICFYDMSSYLLAEKGGIESAASIHVRFLYSEQTFRWTLRIDGQPLYSSSVTPFKGTDTISPFVCLATRD